MLTNDDLQKAFRLISPLHPDKGVALCVLLDACDRIPVIKKLQEKRPDATSPFKLKIPEESLLQLCVYRVSDEWEKDQESDHPVKEPGYQPTHDDLLTRYVKILAWKALDRHSRHAAVGLGCLLYTYQPHEVSSLAEDFFDSDNIRRDKSWMLGQIKKRFQGVGGLANGDEHVAFEVPSTRQRELIQLSLSRFAPWCSCSTTTDRMPATFLLETYFSKDSKKSEWERVHALFDPACGGFARLVHEYNSTCPKGSDMRLDDPEKKLGSPKFSDGSHKPTRDGGDGGPSDPGYRFNPSPLTDADMSSIKHALKRNQRRRKNYKSGRLRVYVDGEEAATFTHDHPLESFAIPYTASCIEVFGEDDAGDLLLAVFPLSCLEAASDTLDQKLYVTHDGGQTIELSISLASGQSHESLGSLVRLEYKESSNQADADVTASDNAASNTYRARKISLGGINPVAVNSNPAVPHHLFWAKTCEDFMQSLMVCALRLVKGRAYDAEDLVQETVCRVLAYSRTPEEIKNPRGYLLRIMRNAWIDKWAKEQTANTDSLEALQDANALKNHPTVEPEVLRILENEELAESLRPLPRRLTQREELLFRLYREGYNDKEIADMLNEDVRLIRSNLNVVRTKVRQRLKAAKKKTSS